MGRVIALANQKGGVAKTTSTLNLAVAFAEEGNKVLAVDLDPQGNLTMSQGLNPDTIERSMYDVLVHRLPIEQIIHNGEIDLAVASIDLAGAELALSSMIGRERALEKALPPVPTDYDFVVIDTPPSLGLLTINALVASSGVIVPVQCEYLSLRGLVQLENTLSMIRENLNPHVGIEGILPTMYDSRTLHSREALEILEENFGDLVFKTRIRKTIRYAEAPVKGTSVLKYEPTGTAARGVPRPGEGGAQWRESAQACVRARSRSCSARPRPPSARPRARSAPPAEPAAGAARPSPSPELPPTPREPAPPPSRAHRSPSRAEPAAEPAVRETRAAPRPRAGVEPLPEPPPRLCRVAARRLRATSRSSASSASAAPG